VTRVPAPGEVTQIIARKAVQNARRDITKRGWKSASALQPFSGTGQVGISSTVNYLLIQNKGFSPFVMWWVKNRTLPLGCKMGDGPHFRNGKNVGTPGYVDIPHRGKVWRPVRWKHPGLPRKAFFEKAITAAIKDSKSETRKAVMAALRGDQ
jgi:hypothetical protein